MKKGTVKWYDSTKGYGFAIADGKEYFMHASSITNEEDRALMNKGDNITFELKDGTPGKGKQTHNVVIIH